MMNNVKTNGVVLLIEDDDIVVDVSRSMIERLGYQVLVAVTGKEALDIVNKAEAPVDLALLDMDMPDLKGHEIFPHLISARPDLKVVICSGQLLDSGAQALLDQGAHDFLQKPFSFKILQDTLVKHLDRRNEPRTALPESTETGRMKIIDISKGGFAFTCDETVNDEDALIDVAVLLAEKGMNMDELECRIVAEKTIKASSSDDDALLKRKSVSFGKMTRKQLDALNELINACSKKL